MFYRLLSDLVHISELLSPSIYFISNSLKWPILYRPAFFTITALISYRAV